MSFSLSQEIQVNLTNPPNMKYRKTFHIEGLWNIEDVEGPLYGTFTCLSGWRSPKPKLFSSQKAPCQIRGFFSKRRYLFSGKKGWGVSPKYKGKKNGPVLSA
jgi:hypothetical protein